MSENSEMIKTPQSAELLEKVLVNGDLSALTPSQRLDYYRQVCESMGLNPLSRPFDYITLKGKLTLYAKKDATDQLRKIHGVSIDDIDVQETQDGFRVKVKGHDKYGRSDVEIGCVARSDMSGNIQNVEMKAVTKAKRRLTLSLCGLGWIDESEIETIPQAKVNVVDVETGELIEEKKALPQKQKFEEEDYLRNGFSIPSGVMKMAYPTAQTFASKDGQLYDEMTTKDLYCHWMGLAKKIKAGGLDQDAVEQISMKISAICSILEHRKQDLLAKDKTE